MKTNENQYNGWKNYQTWNVKLWIDNDQSTQEHYLSLAQEIYAQAKADAVVTKEYQAKFKLAEVIYDEYRAAMYDILESNRIECSVWADILGNALSQVDWTEISENLLEDVKEGIAS